MKKLIYKIAKRIVLKRIENDPEKLTVKHLFDRGWIVEYDEVLEKGFMVEENIKERDKIWVEFALDFTWYRVYHGKDRTFIALESSLEWFEWHFLLAHPDNRHKFLGIK